MNGKRLVVCVVAVMLMVGGCVAVPVGGYYGGGYTYYNLPPGYAYQMDPVMGPVIIALATGAIVSLATVRREHHHHHFYRIPPPHHMRHYHHHRHYHRW